MNSQMAEYNVKKIILLLSSSLVFITVCARATPNIQYESAEHIFMGDHVILTGLGQKTSDHPIKLPLENGLQLTYGEIVAMPDFYGDPSHSISGASTFAKRKKRFDKIFSDFSHGDVTYFNQFWPIIQNECDLVMKAVKAHQDVTKVYAAISDQENIALALATNFRYLSLTLTDFDHFNQDAISAYQVGHAVAIDTALAGFQILSGNNAAANATCAKIADYSACLAQLAKNKLIAAYAQNAFSCHFLSDRFAAGHMRTPYRALYETRPIAILGALSGNLMHDEDNRLGVIVTNNSGKYWIAYGDKYYFSKKNATNKKILSDTLQASADEITSAFQLGMDPDLHSQKIIARIPTPVEPGKMVTIDGIGSVVQTAPLYQIILGSVWQRIDVNNANDDQWTPIWSTWVTLITYHATDQSNIPMKWQLILSQHHMNDFLSRLGMYDHTGVPLKISAGRQRSETER